MKSYSLVDEKPDRLAELSNGFRTGRLSVRDYLNKLERVFVKREPWVKAFVPERVNRFERLHRELTELEFRFRDAFSRPSFYGIPVAVKDIFHVEGFPTYAGSRIPAEVLRGPEAKVISDLKSAGALVLGKTITAEFAYCAPGPTRNPHHLQHTPGGSSSGSAAAIAAGLCPFALGTQTGGSIIRPAAFCGVVGFKPSYGRISTRGIIPLSQSLDHVGFFTADVEGALLAASVLCNGWDRRIRTDSPPVIGVPDVPFLEKAGDQGLKHFRTICKNLSADFKIVSVEMLEGIDELIERHHKLLAAEAAVAHRKWFSEYWKNYNEKTANMIQEGKTIGLDILRTYRAG